MSLSTFFAINTVLAIGFGLGFVLVPATLAELYGLDLGEGGLFVGRLFGTVLLYVGLLVWQARGFVDQPAARSVLLSGFVGDGIGLIIIVLAQLGGLLNAVGWSAVAIYVFLTAARAYYLFVKSETPAPQPS